MAFEKHNERKPLNGRRNITQEPAPPSKRAKKEQSEKKPINGVLQRVKFLQDKTDTHSGKAVLMPGIEDAETYNKGKSYLRDFSEQTGVKIDRNKSQSEQKANNPLVGQSPKLKNNCVKFYIDVTEKYGAVIVQNHQLYTQGDKLCVSGLKGETIKKALCRDVRFLPCLENSVWKLVENQSFVLESSQLVDDLEGRFFEIEFEIGIPVKLTKLLNNHSETVGYLSWENMGRKGSATCFVFNKQFIFTCWHVVREIVGQGVNQALWAGIISECVQVSFGYEENIERERNSFSLDPWFEVGDKSLDYAVLKLNRGVEAPVFYGVTKILTPVAVSDVIHLIGHPNGQRKKMEKCFVIHQSQQEQEFQARQAELSDVHVSENSDVIFYHTSFYFEASGSPLFNSEGLLVGMHAGPNLDSREGNAKPFGFGPSMYAILSHIKQNFPICFEEMTDLPDEEMASLEY
ncbi:serine protease FAM111A-like [Sorex araneus]|uniref:serine protease FAM111A-like n=1 Tax=Sorex araneus TaxID=42254 RepID=UPI0024339637|nr:serine protease FAM111A-like [Sorex araneus]XP_054998445.1 serine protease FAM111A-like [Sorex araneus]XP_054998446.1 serine protease FAM111A-like [Sorex araneus]